MVREVSYIRRGLHDDSYAIDPDGPNNGVDPFVAWCVLDAKREVGITVSHPKNMTALKL